MYRKSISKCPAQTDEELRGEELLYIEHNRCIENNDLEGLKKVVEETGLVGNEILFDNSIKVGNLDVVRYLHEHGCPAYGNFCIFRALFLGNVAIATYLSQANFSWDSAGISAACALGSIEALELLKSIDVNLEPWMIRIILERGNQKCVEYLIATGYRLAGKDLRYLCNSGNLDIVRMVHHLSVYEIGEESSPYMETCHLEIIKYLYEVMKIEMDVASLNEQITYGDLSIVKYMIENGCKPNEESAIQALDSFSVEMTKYLHEAGAPFPTQNALYTNYDWNNNVCKYYHDNIYDKSLCKKKCKFCRDMKIETLGETWYLIDGNFQVYNQWLPREMMEDVVELVPLAYLHA